MGSVGSGSSECCWLFWVFSSIFSLDNFGLVELIFCVWGIGDASVCGSVGTGWGGWTGEVGEATACGVFLICWGLSMLLGVCSSSI